MLQKVLFSVDSYLWRPEVEVEAVFGDAALRVPHGRAPKVTLKSASGHLRLQMSRYD